MSFFSKMLLQIKSKNITIKTETINIKENDGGKQMRDRKDTRGITIIALVITIVLLLILAGVTISLVLGDNGLLNRAQQSKKVYTISGVQEEIQLAIADITAFPIKSLIIWYM